MKKCGIYIMLVSMLLLTTVGCGNTQSSVVQKQAMENRQDDAELTAVAVVQSVDFDAGTIVLQDTATQEEETFSYTGGTEILSRNDVALVAEQLSCGEIVEVTYSGGDEKKLSKIQVSKDAWEYTSVLGKNIDREEGTITVTGRTYAYDEQVSVFDDDQKKMLLDLNDSDEVKIKGIGQKVCSFQIVKGHGFIRLQGQDAFVGGTIEVDRALFQKVQQNMLLTVGEGEHTIVLKNGELEAQEQVTVAKDEEVSLDLSKYVQPEKTEGTVKFLVTPSDATLKINGKVQAVNQEITLPYGNYNVQVSADGYQNYTGILRVQKNQVACQKIYVELVEDASATASPKASMESGNATAGPEVSSAATVTPEGTAGTAQGTITIQTPDGASVYMNGVYQGVAPITFAKVTGEVTITLAKDGCVTKSYTISVPSGNGDAEYSFADLETAK